jgi:hypothetical protein
MALVLGAPDSSHLQLVLPADAANAAIDASALQSWADGQALEMAVKAHLMEIWRTTPIEQAHFHEIVIGEAPASGTTAGPWVELSSLALDRLGSVDPSQIASAPPSLNLAGDQLSSTLVDLDLSGRQALWGSLVSAVTADGAGEGSGEVGFVSKSQLVAAVADAVFADGVKSGDVVGPVDTTYGPELFLVEATYPGPLDERSIAAMTQVRQASPVDPVALTERYSPQDVPLARDAGWRAKAEFGADEQASDALFSTPIGACSDPFVLDGKLGMAIVDERKTELPSSSMLDRLSLDGYSAWLASEASKATISRNLNPLPELASPGPASAAPSLSASTATAAPSQAAPRQPAPTPVRTDELGLPVLP